VISRPHNGTIILWAFNFTINPYLKKCGIVFNVHVLTPRTHHIRSTIIQDSNRSVAKWTALINVAPKYYYIPKIKKKQTTLNIGCN